MSDSTSQQLQTFYTKYLRQELAFTKEVVDTLEMDVHQTFVKVGERQFGCLLTSTSMATATVVVGNKSEAYNLLHKEKGKIQLRLAIGRTISGTPLSFIITCTIKDLIAYPGRDDLILVNLIFAAKPSEDFIELIGQYNEALENSGTYADERIIMASDVRRRIGLAGEDGTVLIQGKLWRSRVRDLSFKGAQFVLLDTDVKPVVGDTVVLRFPFANRDTPLEVPGILTRITVLPEDRRIVVLGMKFTNTPMLYKLRLSNYILKYVHKPVIPYGKGKKKPDDKTSGKDGEKPQSSDSNTESTDNSAKSIDSNVKPADSNTMSVSKTENTPPEAAT